MFHCYAAMLNHEVIKLQIVKSGQILCALKPYFLMLGHILCLDFTLYAMCDLLMFYSTICTCVQ